MKDYQSIESLAQEIVDALPLREHPPKMAVIVGSGGDKFVDAFDVVKRVSYTDLPGMPSRRVEGHSGSLFLCEAAGIPFLAFAGRPHFYQGYSMAEIALAVRASYLLGCRHLLLTNASGGVNPKLAPGDLLLVQDHLNLMGSNPLLDFHDDRLGTRFQHMSDVYHADARAVMLAIAKRKSIQLKEGVYAAVTGPNYETPAEVRMIRMIGADAVGMSTVPEAMAAQQLGMTTVAFSCVANSYGENGEAADAPTHDEVLTNAASCYEKIAVLVEEYLKEVFA